MRAARPARRPARRGRASRRACGVQRAAAPVAGRPRRAVRAARAGAARARVAASARATAGQRGDAPRAAAPRRAVKRSGVKRVDDDRVELERPGSSRSDARSAPRLGDRELLGARDGDDRGLLRVGERRVDRRALARDRPAARRGGERARRAEHRDAVPGRGRVDDDEVVGVGARRAAVELGELPELADGQQLAHARRRGGEQAEDAAAGEDARRAAARQLVAQVLLERVLGVDRDVKQAGRELDLLERLAGRRRVERARDVAAARDLGDDRALARARGDEPERRRDRRLADAALAGDDEQAVVEQTLHVRLRVRVASGRPAIPKLPEWVGGRRVAACSLADSACSRGFPVRRSCRVCGACGEVRLV